MAELLAERAAVDVFTVASKWAVAIMLVKQNAVLKFFFNLQLPSASVQFVLGVARDFMFLLFFLFTYV